MGKTLTRAQLADLEGIAYWIADRAYYIERNRPGANDGELLKYDATMRSLFDEADRHGTPWTAQNAVICWAEDWRREASEYITSFLARRGWTIAA